LLGEGRQQACLEARSSVCEWRVVRFHPLGMPDPQNAKPAIRCDLGIDREI